MIRINLLPTKKHQEAEDSKRQLLLFAVLLVVVCVVLYFPLQIKQAELAKVKGENQNAASEIKTLKDELKTVESSTKERDSLKQQLDVLVSLERDRSGPVRVMDEMQMILSQPRNELESLTFGNRGWNTKWEPDRLWFNSFNETGGRFLLKGGARSSDDVAEFLQRLASSVYFSDVQLVQALQKSSKTSPAMVFEFISIEVVGSLSYNPNKPKEPEKGKKGKKGKKGGKG